MPQLRCAALTYNPPQPPRANMASDRQPENPVESSSAEQGQVTAILSAAHGDGGLQREDLDRLFGLIYVELRRIAARTLGPGQGATLNPTALVHEAYAKLIGGNPLDIEGRIKGRCPLVAEIVMLGDRRPYCVALVWLDPDAVKGREERSGRNRPFDEASQDPALAAEVTAVVDEVNATLPSYATIKRTLILDHPIDAESGLLTPSMKVKRNVVAARYQGRLDEMYAL